MIQKITLSLLRFILFFSIFLCTETSFYGQTKAINPQVLSFDRICAGTDNAYNATFTYAGFPTETVFVVELSTNNFATVIATTTLGVTDPAANQKTIQFAVPTNLVGSDNYSLRVSTTGFSSGKFVSFAFKNAFPIYYKAHDRQYTINNFVGTATFCSGGSYLLSIDPDSTNPLNDSPLKYNFLTYNWYRDNGVSQVPTLVAAASGPSYSVTTEGVYYVETNYGTCTSESYSNRVTVTSATASGSNFNIESSLGNPFCSSGDGTILTAQTTGNAYQWYKDGTKIKDATTRTYQTNEPGTYMISVNFGTCDASSSIVLKSNGFTASIDVPEDNVIDAGTSLKATITTDASSATYEWFLNGTAIANANTNTFDADKRGNYSVKISQSAGCVVTKEFKFTISFGTDPVTSITKIANIISLSSYPYDVWDIPSEYKNPETRVIILSSNGDKVIDTLNYQGDWPPPGTLDFKNVNPVYYYVIQSDTGEKKGSITVIK